MVNTHKNPKQDKKEPKKPNTSGVRSILEMVDERLRRLTELMFNKQKQKQKL